MAITRSRSFFKARDERGAKERRCRHHVKVWFCDASLCGAPQALFLVPKDRNNIVLKRSMEFHV